MKKFNIILFDEFETLDAFGPAEIIGKIKNEYELGYFSLEGKTVKSSQNIKVKTLPFSQMVLEDSVLLIPGGMGTRILVNDEQFIQQIKTCANEAKYVLTVCTGAALLAKTNLLNSCNATTNKVAFKWVESINKAVNWQKKARWVTDGKYYSSSGVSAGMDMTLGFIKDMHGLNAAINICNAIEYIWNDDKEIDPFALF